MEHEKQSEKRRYPRVNLPLFCRPASIFSPARPVRNISLGGLRVYSDNAFRLNEKLTIEIILPDNHTVQSHVRVVWIEKQEKGSPAKFDIGLEFLDPPGNIEEKLKGFLNPDPGK